MNNNWQDVALEEAQQALSAELYAVYRFFCQIPGCADRIRLREGELCHDPECTTPEDIPHPRGWHVIVHLEQKVVLAYVCPKHTREEVKALMAWLDEES